MTSISTDTIPQNLSPEVVFRESCKRNEDVRVSAFLQRKMTAERIAAGILLVPGLPIIGLLIVLIRCTSKGPAIFKQKRVGMNGAEYTMYKLRTMRLDAEVKTGAIWSTKNDPRITLVGGFLRKLHLDELPQLFNVLWGDMSLVGPRPERPEFVRVLEENVPGYCDRLRVLPGVTGLAQVNLPPDTCLASVRDKVRLDIEYVKTADMGLDVRIIICTMLKMFFIPSNIRVRLTGVQREINGVCSDKQLAEMSLTPEHLKGPGSNGRHHSSNRHPKKPK